LSQRYVPAQIVSSDEPEFGAYRPTGIQGWLLSIVKIPPLNRGKFRRPSANLIRSMSPNGIVDTKMRNASFRLRTGTNLIEDAILVCPKYNAKEIDFLIAGTPSDGVFIDLGANIGLYTLAIAKNIGPEGRVLAVDANADIIAALEFNIAASQCNNIIVANVAVGESDGLARLEIRKDDLAIVEVAEDPTGNIQIRPLADVVRDAGLTRVDTLKADIEGYEDRALIPYLLEVPDALRPNRMVIEHLSRSEWKTDCFPVFESLGYRIVGKARSNTLFQRN